VEAGSNTSTVALRVIGATKREPSVWGYNWAIVSWQKLLTWKILQLPRSRHSRLATISQLSTNFVPCLLHLSTDHAEKPRFHCYSPTVALSIICCLSMRTCLPSRCPKNGSGTSAFFAVIAQQRLYTPQYLLHSVQTGSGAHPASYPMGTRG
jgi:hypothetical protein